jgi:Papain-like cysteine protease AvrRpt2
MATVSRSSSLWSARYRVPVRWPPVILPWVWHLLSLSVPHQLEDNWCWAATSDGINHFYDPSSTWTQCEIANSELGRTDCCGSGASGPCNVYGYLDQALTIVGNFKTVADQAATFSEVVTELIADRPLGVRVAWAGGGAHFLAIGGYLSWFGLFESVHVEDPWYGPSDVAFSTLQSSYQGSGSWTNTYWTKS